MPRQTEGWKERKTTFYRTLQPTAGGPHSTTAEDWHLKVKDTASLVTGPDFDPAHTKLFWSTFKLCGFVSTCKNQAISMISSGEKVD